MLQKVAVIRYYNGHYLEQWVHIAIAHEEQTRLSGLMCVSYAPKVARLHYM